MRGPRAGRPPMGRPARRGRGAGPLRHRHAGRSNAPRPGRGPGPLPPADTSARTYKNTAGNGTRQPRHPQARGVRGPGAEDGRIAGRVKGSTAQGASTATAQRAGGDRGGQGSPPRFGAGRESEGRSTKTAPAPEDGTQRAPRARGSAPKRGEGGWRGAGGRSGASPPPPRGFGGQRAPRLSTAATRGATHAVSTAATRGASAFHCRDLPHGSRTGARRPAKRSRTGARRPAHGSRTGARRQAGERSEPRPHVCVRARVRERNSWERLYLVGIWSLSN